MRTVMLMRTALLVVCFWSGWAWAQGALTGSWNGTLSGQPVAITLDGQGGGKVDGRPIRYQVMGQMLMVEDQGQLATYQFEVRGNQLLVAGGQLPGLLTLNRGVAKAAPAPGGTVGSGAGAGAGTAGTRSASGVYPQLVGKWCKMSTFSANGGGGSQSSACFELRGDGSYVYGSERSMSAYGGGMYGATSGSSGDAGRWSATEGSITAQSNSGRSSTYRLELRNHPKNRDPMVCLDGECYVTYFKKAPW